MIAQLAMYDMAQLQGANDTYWSEIRDELGYGPAKLTRDSDVWSVWQSPELLLAQTCGYPYRARLHGKVQLVGTPDYALPDCPPGHYCSVFVVRADDSRQELAAFDGARFAYNEAMSQSGWAAPICHMLKYDMKPGELVETGGHAFSAQAVAEGKADFAGLDLLIWTLLQAHGDQTGLREIGCTPATPVLPYITALKNDPAQIAGSITRAIDRLPGDARALLHLNGLVQIPSSDYLAVPTPPSPENL